VSEPVVLLAGRSNTGKSTLFNRLIGSRAALAADISGLTRDLRYGTFSLSGQAVTLVDTAGWPSPDSDLSEATDRQTEQAIAKAALVVYVADARIGPNADDIDNIRRLRKANRPLVLAVNKIDGVNPSAVLPEFNALGIAETVAIAAIQSRGLQSLQDCLFHQLTRLDQLQPEQVASAVGEMVDSTDDGLKVALTGRPNVGKSTLVNSLLEYERMLVSDTPGTTHDSILVPFSRAGRTYHLIDTAGIRRRSRIRQLDEACSVAQSLDSINKADVVIFMADALTGLVDQDLHLIGHIQKSGHPLVVAINKWDGIGQAEKMRVQSQLDRRLTFARYVNRCFISALKGLGIDDLFASVNAAADGVQKRLSTAALTRVLIDQVQKNPPPIGFQNRRIKLRYAHLAGRNPLVIFVHGNQVQRVPESYRRFLENGFRDAFQLQGTPVRVEFRATQNPYGDRRNLLTPRQVRQRMRLLKKAK